MTDVPGYRRLKVWQKTHQVALDILVLVEALPEKAGLKRIIDQIIGSATSVGANIAEGSNSRSGKEYIRYLEIALRSATETDNWLQICKDSMVIKRYLDIELLIRIEQSNIETIKMLSKMISSLKKMRIQEAETGYMVYESAEKYG
ncbi:MAG TPA: four helix bundle protein [bacterium]|nr:four helix bundle protein [bacterium]HPJ71066.1 four helix bundle protein [bacterium]HPQ65847.1 four helix bundle protein [bacterium]